jgi:hypothetical protein
MNNSDYYTGTDTRLRNFIRQYSGDLKQNNLDNIRLTQSSHPAQMYKLTPKNDHHIMNE